jgi:hypothetical protein
VRGISRHVVRFVDYDGRLYALKELPRRLAEREFRLLRRLAEEEMPVVEAVGLAVGRGGDLDAVLITRHLEFSIPYRELFSGRGVPDLHDTLLNALAGLLVRLHLAGFYWGDCSLSNTLFRRDAGALTAYLVDAETAEMHPSLSDGQRAYDLELAEEHLAGEMLDLGADDISAELISRYEALWDELVREDVFRHDEGYRIEQRLRRLNDLGFDVEEMELETVPEGLRLRLDPQLVEPGHHRRRLLMLTGLEAQENQARRMLNDLARFRAEAGGQLPESVAAYRWRAEVFEPTVAAVPVELYGKRQIAEIFHEILEHRWYLSEQSGTDVGMQAAVASYVSGVLPHAPDERTVFDEGPYMDWN